MGGLDLASKGLAKRLVGVAAVGCPDKVLVEPASTDGYLMDKLADAPACGDPMPPGNTRLTADELAAFRAWIAAVVEQGR